MPRAGSPQYQNKLVLIGPIQDFGYDKVSVLINVFPELFHNETSFLNLDTIVLSQFQAAFD